MYRNNCDSVIPAQTRFLGPTRRSVSGVHMFRGESPIEFESTLERDFIIRTEFFLSVLDIIPQPVKIPFITSNGHPYTYTPDFLVYYRLSDYSYDKYPKPLLVEVKPESQWKENKEKWKQKWKAAHRYAIDQGWKFHIYDETHIRDQVFRNIQFLDRYKRMCFPPEDSEWVLANLRSMGAAPVHYLLARHFNGIYRTAGIAHIWHLLAARKLDTDMSLPLSDLTELWVPEDVKRN